MEDSHETHPQKIINMKDFGLKVTNGAVYTELFISNKFVRVKLPPAGNISFLSEGPEGAIDMAPAA